MPVARCEAVREDGCECTQCVLNTVCSNVEGVQALRKLTPLTLVHICNHHSDIHGRTPLWYAAYFCVLPVLGALLPITTSDTFEHDALSVIEAIVSGDFRCTHAINVRRLACSMELRISYVDRLDAFSMIVRRMYDLNMHIAHIVHNLADTLIQLNVRGEAGEYLRESNHVARWVDIVSCLTDNDVEIIVQRECNPKFYARYQVVWRVLFRRAVTTCDQKVAMNFLTHGVLNMTVIDTMLDAFGDTILYSGTQPPIWTILESPLGNDCMIALLDRIPERELRELFAESVDSGHWVASHAFMSTFPNMLLKTNITNFLLYLIHRLAACTMSIQKTPEDALEYLYTHCAHNTHLLVPYMLRDDVISALPNMRECSGEHVIAKMIDENAIRQSEVKASIAFWAAMIAHTSPEHWVNANGVHLSTMLKTRCDVVNIDVNKLFPVRTKSARY